MFGMLIISELFGSYISILKELFVCLFSDCLTRNIEPVGEQFLAHVRRKLNNHSFSDDDRIQAEAATEQAEETISEDSEEETPDLLNRDPKDWKVTI
jgi:hypothetical protein